MQVNKAGLVNAKRLIKQGEVSYSKWSFSVSDENKLLGGKDGDNWAEYKKWFLGEDTNQKPKTKARYKYPIGKNGKVFVAALDAVRIRAAQQAALPIFNAAGGLIVMAKEQKEQKSTARDLEVRSVGEIRGITDEGIVEAYLTKWGTVDAYRSTFVEGSFKKTFQERGDKIRLLWDHDVLIGKVIETREDQYGPWVKGQINMNTAAGRDAYEHIRAGDVTAFSFGFNTIKDKVVDRVRMISEVKCMEASPVIFPANEQASIVSIRKITASGGDEEFETSILNRDETRNDLNPDVTIQIDTPGLSAELDEKVKGVFKSMQATEEERATDYAETLLLDKLRSEGEFLMSALWTTLNDIWWDGAMTETADQIVPNTDAALQTFHGAYLEWAANYIERFYSGERSIPGEHEIAAALFRHSKGDLEGVAKDTSFKLQELLDMRNGGLLPMESRGKLAELPEEIQQAHQTERTKAVMTLCDELRHGGFSEAERARFNALLFDPKDKEVPADTTDEEGEAFVSEIRNLREKLDKGDEEDA